MPCPMDTKLNTGQTMPLLGLGTSKDDPLKVKAATVEALKQGYRLIDTAFLYHNEKVIGEALKLAVEEGIVSREEVFVVTKLPPFGHSRKDVSKYLKMQLEILQLSYVDLYLIHMPFPCKIKNPSMPFDLKNIEPDYDTKLTETWKAMEDCVDLGLTKSIGVSNFSMEQISTICDNCRIKPSNLQIECHIFLQQEKVLRFCQERGIVITAYAPLGSPAAPDYFKRKHNVDFPKHSTVLDETVILDLASKYGKTPAQIALRWMVQRGICVVPKSVTFSRIKENFEIFDFSLDASDMQLIKNLNRNERHFNYEGFRVFQNHKFFPFNNEVDFD